MESGWCGAGTSAGRRAPAVRNPSRAFLYFLERVRGSDEHVILRILVEYLREGQDAVSGDAVRRRGASIPLKTRLAVNRTSLDVRGLAVVAVHEAQFGLGFSKYVVADGRLTGRVPRLLRLVFGNVISGSI